MSALWKAVLVDGEFGVRCAAQRLRSNLADVTSPLESSRCWLAQRFRATTSPGFGERVQPLRLMAALILALRDLAAPGYRATAKANLSHRH